MAREYHHFTTAEIRTIRAHAAERKTGAWIAETMGLTLWSVRGACRRNGIELWGKPGKKPRVPSATNTMFVGESVFT